jgi:SAM-dependent methyltransferase
LTVTANPEIQRWHDRYESSAGDSELCIDPVGEPELVDHLHFLDGQGLAIEIACGKGANALYLAGLGYQVVACDGALSCLAICQRSARRLGLPVYPAVCDVEAMVLPQESFGLISVVRYLQRSLFDRMISALIPGGLIFYKTFNTGKRK